MVRGPEAAGGDPTTAALAEAVMAAKRGDPLAPVTVVAPSGYAAVFFRRALGARVAGGGLRGIANVTCTTADGLVRDLGGPGLATRGWRPAPAHVDVEAIRAEAEGVGGWLAAMAGHDRALAVLARACGELRRCPVEVVEHFTRRRDRAGDLATLVLGVRERLHRGGYADDLDVAGAALEAACAEGADQASAGAIVDASGASRLAPRHREVLDAVRSLDVRADARGGEPTGLTEVRPCADPGEEARAAVRAVIASSESGMPLWRQAVFHPASRTYARALQQEFASAGVAVNGPGSRRLDRSAAATTLLALLHLPATDFARDTVVAWLSAGPVRTGPNGRRVPAARWDALSAGAGVVRGPAQWHERLSHFAAREPERADQALALRGFVADLVARSRPPGGSWSARAEWAAGLFDHYLDVDRRWPADELAAAEQVRDVLRGLGELDTVHGPGTAARLDMSVFLRMLRSTLEATELDPADEARGGFGDGVFLAPFGFADGLRFGSTTLVGLADAIVPGWMGDDALLPEEVRRADPSGALRTRSIRLEEMKWSVESAVRAGAERRTATYPRADPRTGREHVRSRWLDMFVSPETAHRPVASFAAGIAQADPPVSARELELHVLERWAADGGDPVDAPPARAAPRLATGIVAVRARSGTDFTRFDGNVGEGRVTPFDRERPVSATRLETYAKCPRRFLFERVLAVERRVYPEDLWRMEATDRGTLVHAILEDYVLERLAGAGRSLERLLETADARLDEAEAGGLVGKPLLWRLDRAAILRNLRRFHDEEGDSQPLAAEFEFGSDADGAAPAVVVTLDDGRAVHFKGKADRVDRTRHGQLVVSDYKTGKQGALRGLSKDPLAGGTLLQLPIYALAARAQFGNGGDVQARYWLLSDQRSAPCYRLVVTPEVEARFADMVALIATAVDAGVFPGAPVGPSAERGFELCRFCDFDTVCPTTRDRQWARKCGNPVLAPARALFEATVPEELAGTVVRTFVDPDEVPA